MISITVLVCELAILAFLQGIGVTVRPNSLIILLIVIFSVTYFIDLSISKLDRKIKLCFTAGYLFRIVLLFWDIYGTKIYVLPQSGADSQAFYHEAIRIAEGESWKVFDLPAFAGSIFKLIGVSKFYMQFIFLCFSMVALYAAYRIMQELEVDIRYRRIAMAVLCFLPNYAILSVLFLRESTIAMMIALSLLMFVKWMTGESSLYFWGSFVPILFASTFHGGVAGVLVGYLLARFFYDKKSQKFHMSIKTVIPAVFVAFLLVFLFNNYADVFFGKMKNVEEVSDIAEATMGEGGSTYAQYVGDSSSVLNMIVYSPIRIIMFQFTPFVWQIRNLRDVIALCFNALFYIYVWYKTIKYLISKKQKHRKAVIIFAIIWFATTFVFAWGVTNVGTAIRHRDKMVAIAGVLFGLTMDRDESLEKDEKDIDIYGRKKENTN